MIPLAFDAVHGTKPNASGNYALGLSSVCAQIDNGNITGRVTDATRAAIAGFQVTVTEGCAYTVVTRVYTWLPTRPAAIRTSPFLGLGRCGILIAVTGVSRRWA